MINYRRINEEYFMMQHESVLKYMQKTEQDYCYIYTMRNNGLFETSLDVQSNSKR